MAKYKQRDKYPKPYDALVSLERNNEETNLERLASSTGYTEGTLGAYIRNRLRILYVFEIPGGGLRVHGIASMTYSDFAYFMSQKSHWVHSKAESLFTSLRDRSLQAFYVAIGNYNSPTLKYRVESFCILLCNAWELLLKARILQLSGEVVLYRSDGKTISLIKSVEKVFPKRNHPIRRNIEKLNEIRDQAVHLLVPDIQHTLSRIFQASVFNYLSCLKDFDYPNPHNSELSGLLSFVTTEKDIDDHIIELKYGSRSGAAVRDFLNRTRDEEKSIDSKEFAIPIGYKFVMTRDAKEGDLAITLADDGESAVLIEVPKDHNKTHPFRSREIIGGVNQKLEALGYKGQRLNAYSFQGILLLEKIRNQEANQYYYKIRNPETHKYSPDLIDLIIHKITNNPNYLVKCKET